MSEEQHDPVAAFGPRLRQLASTTDDLSCLEVFAELLTLRTDGTRPHLFTALLRPDGRLGIATIGHAGSGTTIQVGDDLELDVVQLWPGETS